MKIVIEGSASKIKRLAGELRTRAKRKGFTMELHEDEKVEEANNEPKTYPNNAKDTVDLVKATTTLEELKAFEADERKTVIEAVEKQKIGLIDVNPEPNLGEGADGSGQEDQ